MSKGRGQQEESQEKDDGWNALWKAIQNEGGQQWVAGHREEEAGEIMRISLVKDLVDGQSFKESRTMNGGKSCLNAFVIVDGSPVYKPEY